MSVDGVTSLVCQKGLVSLALQGKQKYQVTNVHVKSKIVKFAHQRIIDMNFTQFVTRPNLACSLANNNSDGRLFSVLIFHETT